MHACSKNSPAFVTRNLCLFAQSHADVLAKLQTDALSGGITTSSLLTAEFVCSCSSIRPHADAVDAPRASIPLATAALVSFQRARNGPRTLPASSQAGQRELPLTSRWHFPDLAEKS